MVNLCYLNIGMHIIVMVIPEEVNFSTPFKRPSYFTPTHFQIKEISSTGESKSFPE